MKTTENEVAIRFVKYTPSEPISKEYDLGETHDPQSVSIDAWKTLINLYFNSNYFKQIQEWYRKLPKEVKKGLERDILEGIDHGLSFLLSQRLSDGYTNERYSLSGEVECSFPKSEFEKCLYDGIHTELRRKIPENVNEEKARQIADDIAKIYLELVKMED